MELKGSQTEKNLMKAFAGESQARNRYTYFASVAKKEGYIQISQIFEETANHEKEHAKRLFKFMTGLSTEITAEFPFGTIGTTLENLKSAVSGENFENTTMYPEFAKTAYKEGFTQIASAFKSIAIAEKQHEKTYRTLIKNIEENKVFKKDTHVKWICINCGYIHEGTVAPSICPACAHEQKYFKTL